MEACHLWPERMMTVSYKSINPVQCTLTRTDFVCPTFPSSDTCFKSPCWSGSVSASLILINLFLQTSLPLPYIYIYIYIYIHTHTHTHIWSLLSPRSSILTWRWRQHASMKRWLLPISPHGTLTQKNITGIVSAMKSLSLKHSKMQQ
jgi:hypothetical protein